MEGKSKDYPVVSVIVPCRNESTHILKCLNSIASGGYPAEKLEVLVVDGQSDDGTVTILKDFSEKHHFVRVLDNSRKITPCALNIGIKNSRGELILWMSAHNEYEKGYIEKCIQYIKEYNADAVGGIIKPVPRNKTLIGQAIALVISSRFGVGNSLHKVGLDRPRWADTAFGVCYKREVFQKVGLFNEKLTRGQDMEFGLRLNKKGIKTLLSPELVSYYYLRSSFRSFISHNFTNGRWVILPFNYSRFIPVSTRHLVPLVFVLSLLICVILAVSGHVFFKSMLGIIAASYFAADLYFSSQIGRKSRKMILAPVIFFIFLLLHLSYGLGSLVGVVQCFFSSDFWRMRMGRKIN
jgi:glycosyltransferase involved in cell wall biosynthesis